MTPVIYKGINCTITLYNADCMDLLPIKADAVVTDPPYGIGFAAQPTNYQRAAGIKPRDWDNTAPDITPLLHLATVVAIWGGNYFTAPPSRGWLSWFKPDRVASMADMELCWTNKNMNARQISWSISATNAERVGHPTQKPVRVMSWTMEQPKIKPGSTVLDPFMGSGTTGIACIRMGMNFIGIERDADYFKIACERIERELDGQLL